VHLQIQHQTDSVLDLKHNAVAHSPHAFDQKRPVYRDDLGNVRHRNRCLDAAAVKIIGLKDQRGAAKAGFGIRVLDRFSDWLGLGFDYPSDYGIY
jgi:hypothetical protein